MPAPPDALEAPPTSRAADETTGPRSGEDVDGEKAAQEASAEGGTSETSASDATRRPHEGARPDHPAPTADGHRGTGGISVPQADAAGEAVSSSALDVASNAAAAESGTAPLSGEGEAADRGASPDAADVGTAAEAISAAPSGRSGAAGHEAPSSAASDDATAAEAATAARSSEGDPAERHAARSRASEAASAKHSSAGDLAERHAVRSTASEAANEGAPVEREEIRSAASEAANEAMATEAAAAARSHGGDPAERDATQGVPSEAADGATAAEAPAATRSDESDATKREETRSAASEAADGATANEGTSATPPGEGDAAEAPPDPALFAHALRIAEALVFASDRPVTPARLGGALPPGCEPRAVLTALSAACAGRAVELVEVAGGFSFRTAPELAPAITRVVEAPRRLPRAAMETLAIVAYHQPVTRAEIEEIRGASLSQSTLELLLDAALIAPRGRKEVPGRPSLWGTTPRFLEQFGLKAIGDLPPRGDLVNEPTLPLSAPPTDAAPPPAA